MGIFDFITNIFSSEKRESEKKTRDAIASVKKAAQASNYNQASIQAFYALEEVGKAYSSIERQISNTAREYGSILAESGNVTTEELEPIIYNFEVAKYSPDEVTFEDYRNVEQSLELVIQKYKSPDVGPSKGKSRKSKRKRSRPKKRATGAGARRRKKQKK